MYKGATYESIILKCLTSFSVTLFITSFIQSTSIITPALHNDTIDKNGVCVQLSLRKLKEEADKQQQIPE